MLVDTHCHLASQKLRGDAGDVIARAIDAGVSRMVAIGTDLNDGPEVIALAEKFDAVRAAVGIHPCDVSLTRRRDPLWPEKMRRWAEHERVVAIGETGLDFFHPPAEGISVEDDRAAQRQSFAYHLELAAALKKPVVVHTRGGSLPEAWSMVQAAPAGVRVVFHCWVEPWEVVQPIIAAGHLVSFTGMVTYKNATEVARVAQQVPEGHFMLETDAPYLAPVPHRGKRCEPSYVRDTATSLADQRGISLEKLAQVTTQAARDFFSNLC